jgi:hypothetical protein
MEIYNKIVEVDGSGEELRRRKKGSDGIWDS